MEYLQDIERISNYTKIQCLNDLTKLEDLREIYYKVFGQYLIINCSNCIDDGLIRIRIELRKYKQNLLKAMEKQNALYILKPGTVIDLTYSTGGYITESNITDEMARELIKRNRNYLRFFDKYPTKEWEEKKQPEAKPVETKQPEAKVPEAKPAEVKKPSIKEELLKKTKVELATIAGLPITTNKSKAEIVDVILSK